MKQSRLPKLILHLENMKNILQVRKSSEVIWPPESHSKSIEKFQL